MIALTGFMGAGKSTLAKMLGQKLGKPVYEVDQIVYQITGLKNMQQVFDKGGEKYLRISELAALEVIAAKADGIIDCGAGLITYELSKNKLVEIAKQIIYLDIDFDLARVRVGDDTNRPLFTQAEEARKRYDMRRPIYQSIATYVIPVTSQSVEDLCLEVMDVIDEE